MKYLVFLLMFSMSCKPTTPDQGFGLEQLTVNGQVDTDGDGDGDTNLENWCPAPILDYPEQSYTASSNIANAVGFDSGYRFRLNENGDVDLCYGGEPEERPLWWTCSNGYIEVYGGGVFALGANPQGLLATVQFINYMWDEGVNVKVTGAKDKETTSGTLWFQDSCN